MRNMTCLMILVFVCPMAFISCSYTGSGDRDTLLTDEFDTLKVGMFSTFVKAHAEYHYRPDAARRGNWVVSTHEGAVGSQRAWWILQENDANIMTQTYDNPINYSHPMVIAGDPLWKDYTIVVSFAPESTGKQSGIVFRYQNDRCYYFFGVKGDKAILKMVRHANAYHEPHEIVLAEKQMSYSSGQYLTARITIQGSRIHAELDNGTVLEAEDTTYPTGNIGLMADVPTRYRSVAVTTTAKEKRLFLARKREREAEEVRLQAANPRMVVWKKIRTPKFGVGRNLRFGDLNNDGVIDVLIGQVVNHGPKGSYSEVSCLTAITFDGDMLWQVGRPDLLKYFLTSDVGVQIHDLDNDGRNEVVYCMNSEIHVADGATGRTKYKAPTPVSKPPEDLYPHILGDCLFFCDLRGTGHDRDIIIKDRQKHFWALNDRLEVLWNGGCGDDSQTGHYPYAYDLDGDGKDEVAIGYALYDDDGTQIWTHDGKFDQHADGVAIVPFYPNTEKEPQIFYAASDEGYMRLDMKGNILKHHYIGHVQSPSVANFRSDLPGLETVSINFHGNQGIITFYDADGNIYHQFEPVQHGSMMLPLNWNGGPEEYFVLSADVEEGGVYDGWGRRVMRFPGDGHPVMCNAVLDITGDPRDEIVVWDPYEIWVYTQEDNPKEGRIYKPERNPLYNISNYQATVSLPGWSR